MLVSFFYQSLTYFWVICRLWGALGPPWAHSRHQNQKTHKKVQKKTETGPPRRPCWAPLSPKRAQPDPQRDPAGHHSLLLSFKMCVFRVVFSRVVFFFRFGLSPGPPGPWKSSQKHAPVHDNRVSQKSEKSGPGPYFCSILGAFLTPWTNFFW